MPDLTIPDAAVEAAARAAYEEGFLRHVRRTRFGFTWDDISDEARESWRQVVIAASPYIAAQALKDMGEWFDRAAQLGTGERDVIAAQACYDRAALYEETNDGR